MNQVSLYNKEMYGEVTTPYVLIDELFDMLDDEVYNNTSMKWWILVLVPVYFLRDYFLLE